MLISVPASAGLSFGTNVSPPGASVASGVVSSYPGGLGSRPIPYGAFAVPGRGLFELGRSEYASIGCDDAQLVGTLEYLTYLIGTRCGPVFVYFGQARPTSGLPSDTELTAIAADPASPPPGLSAELLVGTSNAGAFRFQTVVDQGGLVTAGRFTPASDGLPSGAAIRALGRVGDAVYAALRSGEVFERGGTGPWRDASRGLPAGATVLALGGGSEPFAALESAGIWRRTASGLWVPDSNGAHGPVYGFAAAGGAVFAAGGTSGVLRRVAGGWLAETAGLPSGTDVRFIGSVRLDLDFFGIRDLVFIATAGEGVFVADARPSLRALPAVVDTDGRAGSRWRTALTIEAFGFGTGNHLFMSLPYFSVSAEASLPFHVDDVAQWLTSVHLSFPQGQPAASLFSTASFPPSPTSIADNFAMLARIYTTDESGGTYGVSLDDTTDVDAAEEQGAVYGLQSLRGDSRSNLAVTHLWSDGPITLRVGVFAADGTPAPRALEKTLAPGEWFQWNDVLLQAGLPDGASGYAKIVRVTGTGAWTAYGVINDAATSDGSVLPLYRPGGLAAARKLLVPVVLDTIGAAGSHYTTELTLANESSRESRVLLRYRAAPGFGAAGVSAAATVVIGAGAQTSIPDVLAYLRAHGIDLPSNASGNRVGTLQVEFADLEGQDSGSSIALARTTTPNLNASVGGRFGVSYPAIAWGGGAQRRALVPALSQDAASRSNLAVLNAGGGSEGPITLSVQLRDADGGGEVVSPLIVTLNPGEWFQWDRVVERAGLTTSKATATVTRISGDDTFFAYGVMNDAKTSDGSFIRMIRLDGE